MIRPISMWRADSDLDRIRLTMTPLGGGIELDLEADRWGLIYTLDHDQAHALRDWLDRWMSHQQPTGLKDGAQ